MDELFDLTHPKGDKYGESWSFSYLIEKYGIHELYGVIINNETAWLVDGEWNPKLMAPRKAWIEPLTEKVRNYSKLAQLKHRDKLLRAEQQLAFNELVMRYTFSEQHGLTLSEALTKACDEFVIFKETSK
jgi:hypothetical protein